MKKKKGPGTVAKKPKAEIPGGGRGQFSKMPQGPNAKAKGPMVHAARGKRLKGIAI